MDQSNIVSPLSPLNQLSNGLSALTATIERGDWDIVVDLQERLIPLLDLVMHPRTPLSVEDSRKIQEVLKTLEFGIRQCASRKSEISTLIEALAKISSV